MAYPIDTATRKMLAKACLNPKNSLENKKWLVKRYCEDCQDATCYPSEDTKSVNCQ